jgi:ABC-type glycerol-3-phosphate transport system substrate-binding protein
MAPRLARQGRRRLLQAAAACGAWVWTRRPRWAEAAAPTALPGGIRLVAAISYTGGVYGGAARDAVEAYLAAHFASRYRGVRVVTVPGPSSDRSSEQYVAAVAAAVAGVGPDVLTGTGYQLPAFSDAGALEPLQPWVRAAGVDLGRFSQQHLAALTRPPQGLVALPAFDSPEVLLINEGLLAEAGSPVPTPDWTYLQATAAWTKATQDRGGTHFYGATLDVEEYVTELFGGRLMNAAATRCLLDDPRVLAAADWLVPLVRRGIVYPVADPAAADGMVRRGRAAFGMCPAMGVQQAARDLAGLGVPWDWLPMPRFPPLPPGHRLTYTSGGWYGMNQHSLQPAELRWELLAFLVLDPGYRELLMQWTWVPPNQLGGWGDWIAFLRRQDPALQHKHLEYYAEAMAYAVPDLWFRYHPYQADTEVKFTLLAIASGRVSPASGLAMLTESINALEEQGAAAPATKPGR